MASDFTTIPVQHTSHSQLSQVDWSHLEFGKYMADHMLSAVYKNGAWTEVGIIPYGPITMMPTALALHYGQSVFEGMKAFRMADGHISIYRIRRHYERLMRTMHRMCMPEIPYALFEEGLKQLIKVDAAWVPEGEGSSLYIRPLVFATEDRFGVKISDEYRLLIMSGPVPPFYPKPLRVKVEDRYSRAAKGGTGHVKCAGNYGGAFYATQKAREEGFDQVLWTDLSEELNIEESGTMNVFFLIDGTLITPPLSDTILEGVTRDSLLTLVGEMNIPVEERKISARELAEACISGRLKEAFGAGTAAVTVPISTIGIRGEIYDLPAYHADSLYLQLQQQMNAIRKGTSPDRFHWNTVV
jgi:branched-chain amino acid aminotransferase